MKISKPKIKDISQFQKQRICGPLNVWSLIAVSMVWGHMLSLINLWFLPLTVLITIIGYGSEINKEKPETVQTINV
jgi:hypothetical protein